MSHTRRTPQFQLLVHRLAEKVLNGTLDSEERGIVARILIENTSDSGCLVKARDDEPIFVLLSRDVLSAGLARLWAVMARDRQLHDPVKINDALECAHEMEAYRGKR